MKSANNSSFNVKSSVLENLSVNNPIYIKQIFCKSKHIHFVGIGGVSVSSLAIYALNAGFIVSGSDSTKSDVTTKLSELGVKIFYSQLQKNVYDADVVVFSSACENNAEVLYAKTAGIPTFSRAQFLAMILKDYKNTICISGAHGKTTTTALIYEILQTAKKCPSLHLGGNLVSLKNSYCYAEKNYIACEACEYKDSFLELKPTIGVILNIAPEHLDYFKTFENVKKSFAQFAKQSEFLVVNGECEISHKNKITFGYNNADFTAKNIVLQKNGKYSFDCYYKKNFYLKIKLNLIGKHNILNALASIAVAHLLQVDKDDIYKALANFKGVERRFEFLHKKKFIVHDYAHHPDEIASSIKETKLFYKKKLLIVFQPHTYSRTKTLMDKFVNVLSIPNVVILPTYSAREKYDKSGSALTLAKKLGKNAVYIQEKKKATEYIMDKINMGYGVLFLGAGDIYSLAKNIAKMC